MKLSEQKELVHKVSLVISEKANECCYRSDGWEEELTLFIEDKIQSVIKQSMEQTR